MTVEGEESLQQRVCKDELQNNVVLHPKMRRRVDSEFVYATVLGVQRENVAAYIHEIWHAKEKDREFDGMCKRRRNANFGIYSSSSIEPRIAQRDCNAAALYASYPSKDDAMTDIEIDDFLGSRVKRGRGTVGPRMNMESCFTSASCSNLQTSDKTEYGKCQMDKYGISGEHMVSRIKHHRGSSLSRLGNKDPSTSPSCPEAKRQSALSRLGCKDSCTSPSCPDAKRESGFLRLSKKDQSVLPSCPEAKRMKVLANAVDAWKLGVISSAGHLF